MYAIKDWNSVFENNKSRQFDVPTYVNWPVRRDSEAFATLMHDSSGIAAFGIFGALVQWMGKRPSSVRKYGILADEKGELTPERFALRMKAPRKVVEAAWARLVSVGWLVAVDEATAECFHTDLQVPAECPQGAREPTPKCYGAERSGEDRSGLERSGAEGDAHDDADEGGGEGKQDRKVISHGHPPARLPARHSAVDDLRGVGDLRSALAALRIDGAALDGLSTSPTLTLDVLRATVEEIEQRANVRNPKRLLVSVLCERHGVKIEKGANVRIGTSDIAGALAKFEEIKRQKFSAGGAK